MAWRAAVCVTSLAYVPCGMQPSKLPDPCMHTAASPRMVRLTSPPPFPLPGPLLRITGNPSPLLSCLSADHGPPDPHHRRPLPLADQGGNPEDPGAADQVCMGAVFDSSQAFRHHRPVLAAILLLNPAWRAQLLCKPFSATAFTRQWQGRPGPRACQNWKPSQAECNVVCPPSAVCLQQGGCRPEAVCAAAADDLCQVPVRPAEGGTLGVAFRVAH